MLTKIDLPTSDGPCPTQLLTPAKGSGPWPAVIFCIDGGGPRDSLVQMASRISDLGYVVAIPDLFHRVGSVFDILPAGMPRDVKSLFPMLAKPDFREQWRQKYYASATNPAHLKVDVGAVLDHLKASKDVKPGPVGVTGYCMGGNCVLRIAGLFGDRIAAAASFHGGGLATEAPDSPHLAASKIRARVYAGCATDDPSCPDEMKQRLDSALTAAQVPHEIETYEGARHGFAVPDSPSFNSPAAERHYAALERVLKAAFPA